MWHKLQISVCSIISFTYAIHIATRISTMVTSKFKPRNCTCASCLLIYYLADDIRKVLQIPKEKPNTVNRHTIQWSIKNGQTCDLQNTTQKLKIEQPGWSGRVSSFCSIMDVTDKRHEHHLA